jgi:transposase
MQEAGFIVEFLPPYSPDLNPIEQLWGNIKAKLKLIYNRSLNYVENIIRAIRFYHV